jgi:alpha-beta hydrolase superfamily lysophospholipase
MGMNELTPEGIRAYQRQEHKRIRARVYRTFHDQPEHLGIGNVVIVHGYRGNTRAEHFKQLANSFDDAGFNTASFDLPNFGKSQALRPELEGQVVSFAELVRAYKSVLFAMLDSRSKSKVPTILVGYSIGALVIVRLLQIYPYLQKHVAGIILIATPLRVDHNARAEILKWKKVLRPLFGVIARAHPGMSVATYEPDEFSQDDPRHYKGAMNSWTAYQILVASERARESMSKIVVPTLFLHGGEDATAPLSDVERAFGELGTASFDKDKIVYPNIDHLLLQRHRHAIQDAVKWGVIRVRLGKEQVTPIHAELGKVEERVDELLHIFFDAGRRLLRWCWHVTGDLVRSALLTKRT